MSQFVGRLFCCVMAFFHTLRAHHYYEQISTPPSSSEFLSSLQLWEGAHSISFLHEAFLMWRVWILPFAPMLLYFVGFCWTFLLIQRTAGTLSAFLFGLILWGWPQYTLGNSNLLQTLFMVLFCLESFYQLNVAYRWQCFLKSPLKADQHKKDDNSISAYAIFLSGLYMASAVAIHYEMLWVAVAQFYLCLFYSYRIGMSQSKVIRALMAYYPGVLLILMISIPLKMFFGAPLFDFSSMSVPFILRWDLDGLRKYIEIWDFYQLASSKKFWPLILISALIFIRLSMKHLAFVLGPIIALCLSILFLNEGNIEVLTFFASLMGLFILCSTIGLIVKNFYPQGKLKYVLMILLLAPCYPMMKVDKSQYKLYVNIEGLGPLEWPHDKVLNASKLANEEIERKWSILTPWE